MKILIPSKELSRKLREYRKKWGISQKNLAEMVGVDRVTIARWETEFCNITKIRYNILVQQGII